MAGRIIAWLMICDPPYQTAGQIATALSASKASVSTNIRLFVDFGIVERFTMPGDRRDRYRLLPTRWPRAMERSLPLLAAFRKVADRGSSWSRGTPRSVAYASARCATSTSSTSRGSASCLARWKAARGA